MKLTSFIKSLNEDNSDSGIVIGKFRILTHEHSKIINEVIKNIGKATIVIVGEYTDTMSLKYKALKNAYGKNNNVEIIPSKNSYIPDILEKCSFNPVALYCSPKNVKSYENMLKSKNLSRISVIDTMQDEDDISSRAIVNINDQTFFEKNTPVAIHSLYNEYIKYYSKLMCESRWDILDTVSEDLFEDEWRPVNSYQSTYPSVDYDNDSVRVPGDNENFDVYDTVKGVKADLTPTVDDAENKQGSCVFDCPEVNEDEGCEGGECGECGECGEGGECDSSAGTGTADIATVDNVIGGMVKHKKPDLMSEHKQFTKYF